MSDNANNQGKPAEKPFRIVLASASPRRRELLEQAGVTFTVHASEVDESLEPDLLANPPEACKKLAERKAGAVEQEIFAPCSGIVFTLREYPVVYEGSLLARILGGC